MTEALDGLRLRQHGYDDPVVRELVAAVQAEYVRRYGGQDATPVDAGEFAPPRGHFVVAWWRAAAVGCGGWRRHEESVAGFPAATVAEVKRMYVDPGARRLGVARIVLTELEESAARAGYRYILLNTGDKQPEAVQLYRSSGYRPVPGFGIYRETPGALFFGKPLAEPPGSG